MISIQISDNLLEAQGLAPVKPEIIENAAWETLKHQQPAGEVDLTIVLTDDNQLKELNREFMEIDAPTDVLSFPSGELDLDSGNLYLGDVIISYPRALEQAQAAGHQVDAELELLTVHGVLHLLGYDHADEEDKARMWSAQDEILALLSARRAQMG